MSFRGHLRVAGAHGVFVAALALTPWGLSPRDRRVLLAFAAVPVVLGALSDTGEGRRLPETASGAVGELEGSAGHVRDV